VNVRQLIAAINALFLLGGCSTAPEYSDNALLVTPSSGTGRLYGAAKLCLVLSDNTNKALEHLAEVHGSGNMPRGADLITEITAILNARFREVELAATLDKAPVQGCNMSLLVDLKARVGVISFQEVSVALAGTFFDDKGARLDSTSGEGRGRVPYPAFSGSGPVFREAWKPTLASFTQGMDASQPVAAYVRTLPSEPRPAALATAPVAVDLAFWDSVKTSTNPADLQAYLQKFPNGSFATLARTRLASLGEAQPVRLTPLPVPAPGTVNFGSYHALVIGIDHYRAVTPLKTAVGDARTVADLLQKEYGFKVTLLVDATRNQILDAFDDLRRALTENDNLLIYYAGHGYLDADSDRGFWLPVDAHADRRANWLSNSDIADVVRATRAKHVLVVADSCYAGTLTRSLSVQMSALDDFSRLAQKRARTALVSGGLEPVEDAGGGGHSVFAKAFLDSLLANTGVVDMSQIFSSMRRQVILSAAQTPQYGDIRQTGHEGGDFIFVRRK